MGSSSKYLRQLLIAAAAGDDSSRERLIERVSERLKELAGMMLRRDFPRLKRWEETDDVYQDAMLRLYQSLSGARVDTARQFFGLAATQVRRTLIDLVRHHFGPEGAAANHDTGFNALVEKPSFPEQRKGPETLTEWSRFHEVVELLPAEAPRLCPVQPLPQQWQPPRPLRLPPPTPLRRTSPA